MNISDDNLDFIVLSHMRSGTHLLCSLLNSHPEIACIGEPHDHIKQYLMENVEQKKINGRLVADNHPYDHLLGKKIIFLHRDPLQTAISRLLAITMMGRLEYAVRKKILHYFTKTELSEKVDMKKAKRLAESIRIVNRCIEKKIVDSDYIEVTYEEMTNDKDVKVLNDETTKKICDFLGVDLHKMSTEFYKPTWNLTKINDE